VHIDQDGNVFLAGNQGLYEVNKQSLTKIKDGSFTDVKTIGAKLLTAEANGLITCWDYP